MNKSRMPSPAILVAVLAVVAALAGTAIAEPDASTSVSKKKTKKIAKKQAQKYFEANISSASVQSAQTANSANTAETAEVAGGPVAIGHISGQISGDVNSARTRGFTSANVTSPAPGRYCFTNLAFEFRIANVTTDFNNSDSFTTAQVALPRAEESPCPASTDAEVSTAFQEGTGGERKDSGFFIAFYN